jgi:hypothetical protein
LEDFVAIVFLIGNQAKADDEIDDLMENHRTERFPRSAEGVYARACSS